MKILLQRVSKASVMVNNQLIGSINKGYLLFIGIIDRDTEQQADWLCSKVANLRLFDGENGTINDHSILESGGEVLVVSQFTLAGNTKKGNRPDYTAAMHPTQAEALYEYTIAKLKALGIAKVATGQFGATMDVELVNNGPVTLMLER